MWPGFIPLLVAASLVGSPSDEATSPAPASRPHEDSTFGRAVRPEHPELRRMIERGANRSPTFRHLLEQLDETSLVAYVRFDRCTGGVGGCLRLVAGQGTSRKVLIVLDRFGRSPSDLTALLAHELQHALEIAQAADVVDAPSFQNFYRSTGFRMSHGFETVAAIRTARIVASELRRGWK